MNDEERKQLIERFEEDLHYFLAHPEHLSDAAQEDVKRLCEFLERTERITGLEDDEQ